MTLLAETLSQRYGYLAALGATAADDPPKFGLRGEICRPDARNRRIDPALPQAVVQELPPTPVFPIHMGEALPGEAETWPNLWAAWMYGVGSVRSAWPGLSAMRGSLSRPRFWPFPRPCRSAASARPGASGLRAAPTSPLRTHGWCCARTAPCPKILRFCGPIRRTGGVLRPCPFKTGC
jgi:hypothetical protein